MKIEIKGFKNLEDVNFEITDKKINMIFGMSGSGKSSISSALLKDNLDDNKTFGKNIEQSVKVNGATELPKISCFNKESLEKFIINKTNDNVFDIFIDSNKDIEKAEKSLKQILNQLKESLNNSIDSYNELLTIKKALGSDLTKKGELKSTAKIIALEKAFSKVSNKKIVNQIINLEPKKFKWIKDGMGFKIEDNCPFCERRILKNKLKNLNDLNEFEEKSLDNYIQIKENDCKALDPIEMSLSGLRKFKKELINIISAITEYEKITDIVSRVETYEYSQWEEGFIPSVNLKKYFPDVYKRSVELFNKIGKLKELMVKAEANTKKILSRRTGKINKYLEQMSIPYKVEASYANKKIKNYKIVHIYDEKTLDRPNALSEGEKNIFSLIMFVFQCKKENNDLINIDDPVSSYDDFRRSQVLKLIEKELDQRTILLLSHDDKFAKYAIADKYKKVDKLYYFQNFGDNVNFINITKDDFGDFNDFVIKRIKTTNDYFQKIINLRLLYEGKHGSYAYGYLSAIVHKSSEYFVSNEINKKNTTEERIIELIKEKYPELSGVEIPLYNDQIKPDLSSFSILEKAIWARENVKESLIEENLIDEMNEFAHINGKLKICLDPYIYNFCTKRLYEYLQKL